MSRPRRRALVLGLRLGLLVLLALAAVVYLPDPGQVGLAFHRVSPRALALFVLLMLGSRAAGAWRWHLICRDSLKLAEVGFGYLFATILLAEFATVWSFSMLGGEAVKLWKASVRCGQPARAALSVALDQMVGTLSLVLLAAPVALSVYGVPAARRTTFPAAALGLRVTSVPWREALSFMIRNRFLAVPLLISFLLYALIVVAHIVLLTDLGVRSWQAAAFLALVPRLGRAIPLSFLGFGGVEGGTLLAGPLVGLRPELALVLVAANVSTKYLAALTGLVVELAANGRRFLRAVAEDSLDAAV